MFSGNKDNIIGFSNKSNAVIPDRIREARIYRGLTQQELANELKLTRQAIYNYEAGINTPLSEILLQLSNKLDFPINFFYKKRVECNDQGEVYFRSSALPSKKKEMLEQKLTYLSTEVVYFIEKFLNLPEVNLVNVNYKEEYTIADINNIVKSLRNHWGLGSKPINNLTYIMQENGCIIARIALESEKTDGYSKWMWNRPYTFLNMEKDAAVRARFTLAHELGHIVLHRNLKKGENIKKREREANYFAGEFLFPSDAALEEMMPVTLDSLIPIKAKWGISIGALVRRCSDLELITEERYLLLQKQMSKRNWRIFEPLDDVIKCETPQLFGEAFKLLIDNKLITKPDILSSILFSENELISICCLEPDFFQENQITLRPKLKIVK